MSETRPTLPSADLAETPAEAAPPAPEQTEQAHLVYRIGRLQIRGFKSFADPTEIRFPEGITAVVGPNGCGKSNIGDALNWVLGEQSAKLLRGSSMKDVIFAGTAGRKPLGMSEVSIHLASTNGAPVDGQGGVTVTRRLYQTGESEYLIDGSRARLKDIQEMLRNAHVGAKTYATIEQGRIDQILNAKPKDRRAIIEDAAGVSGFKHKRRLAELKLEATRANLLRVSDIVAEVKRQINSLKRQAARARRYQRLRDELRGKERIRFATRARALDAELARLQAVEATARDAEAQGMAVLARLDAEVTSVRQELEEADRAFRENARRFHQLEGEIDGEEERIRLGRQRIAEADEAARQHDAEVETLAARLEEAEGRLVAQREAFEVEGREAQLAQERLLANQAELEESTRARDALRQRVDQLRNEMFDAMSAVAERRNEQRALDEALERCRGQLRRLEQERAETGQDLSRLEEEAGNVAREADAAREEAARSREQSRCAEKALQEARKAHASDLQALTAAREQEKSTAVRLRTLEDVATRFAGVSDGVRMLLTAGPSSGVRALGVVADYVEAGREFESAAEVYLQGLLPTVVLEDDADAARAVSLLHSEKAGRTSVLSRTQPAGAPAVGGGVNGRPPFADELLRDRRVLGRLGDHLRVKPETNGLLRERIGDALVVDCLETALELHRRFPQADYLTPSGEVVYASGLLAAGGTVAADQGLLAHKRKTEEAATQLAEASALVGSLLERESAGRIAAERLEEELGSFRERAEEAGRRLVELEMRAQRSDEESGRARRRGEVLGDEVEGLEEDAARLGRRHDEAHKAVHEAEKAREGAEARLGRESDELKNAESALHGLVEENAALREQLAARTQRVETSRREAGQQKALLADLAERIAAARGHAEQARARSEAAAQAVARGEAALADRVTRRESQAGAVGEQERSIAERRTRLARLEEELRARRTDQEGRRQATAAAEVARARAEADRQHLDDLCFQELGVAAADVSHGADEEAAGTELDTLEQEIAELRERIERIGPVNMMAIEEFSDLEQRYAFLTAQRQDLEQSMESLRETIRRINRSSRQRFTEAFEIIRGNYQEVFRVLFNGGRADLMLEEGEDVLECGIEILAQPPGKRLGNVQLLSGGEKAMAAIALLFAIFRYQPSPFCLLDEVDAALDDVNIGRFTRMLVEYAKDTQFIIVTHNKLTMEVANLLYGVTMEEPGVSKLVSLQLQ